MAFNKVCVLFLVVCFLAVAFAVDKKDDLKAEGGALYGAYAVPPIGLGYGYGLHGLHGYGALGYGHGVVLGR